MRLAPLDRFLLGEGILHVAVDGQMRSLDVLPRVLLPGSFNPVHRGHWELARVASEQLNAPVAFELSIRNVDKPNLSPDEVRRRLAPFNWQASVYLTRAALFEDKAGLFPGVTFIVGADTAERILSPRYYGNDGARMIISLRHIAERGCRFLVACRIDERGKCLRCVDLAIPDGFQSLFEEIPPERFRCDESSSALRA